MSDFRPSVIMDRIRSAFTSIGREDGPKPTRAPVFESNRDAVAWELHIARDLETVARERARQARKAADEAGVTFDHEQDPMKPGTREVIYDGIVLVQVDVRNPSSKVDQKAFRNALEVAGVSPQVIADAERVATTQTKPAHYFTTMLRGAALTGVSNK